MHASGHFAIGSVEVLVAIFALGMFIRLVSARRLGVLALLVMAGVFLLYGLRVARVAPAPPPAVRSAAMEIVSGPVRAVAVMEAPAPPEKPAKSKRGPKPKPEAKSVPAAPTTPPVGDTPPEPPVAAVTETTEPQSLAASVDEGAPIALFLGTSTTGRPIDSLPDWVMKLENAPPGSSLISFSSDRFASIEEAEKQLWSKARDVVSRELQPRLTKYAQWLPPADFTKSHGLILERCIERTTIDVGKFVEPMYRVHWKVSLSKSVRDSLISAYRPTVQQQRLQETALGFLGATALLAFVNVILRLAPCPNTKATPPAAV
jgi:hypothetical protein